MRYPTARTKQPQPVELQSLQQLLQGGLFSLLEAKTKNLLQTYPNSPTLYNFLGLSQQAQAKNQEAAVSFRQLSTLMPKVAEIHYNLGVVLAQIGAPQEAINSYRQALALKPELTMAHFNLGALLQAEGLLAEAAAQYRATLDLEPDFVPALGNLGTVLQESGHLAAAEQCYRNVLTLAPDARGYFNLATTLHDKGEHQAAMVAFRHALDLEPEFADAWNNLGETLRDHGEMQEAVQCYRRALAIAPDHARANYNMGESFCLGGQLVAAIPYFERSDFADAPERALQCYYKTGQFDIFKAKFDALVASGYPSSVLLGTLATHYASNFGIEDNYTYCKTPMDYVQHTRIEALTTPESPLLAELLDAIEHIAIAERKQGRLYYGMQSAGNLLLRSEPAIVQLAALIRTKVTAYQQHFAKYQDDLITRFPKQIEFTSSWYLRMHQGGHLTSHIHEEGWISGCVYLKLPPKRDAHEGSFEYSTDGDDYPRLHDNFPRQIVDQQVGDLVLFPSSLFHRTLPFHSAEERVCIAFDVNPPER